MIRQRPDGRWEARYTAGYDPATGKQIQRAVYANTQGEVRKKLAQAINALDEGTYIEPNKITVSKWLKVWLAEYTGNIKEHTRTTYETQLRVHILPNLGALKLTALTPPHIQAFYNKLQKETGLSPKTIKNIHGVLHRALDQAVLLSYIRFNPCIGVTLPRMEKPKIKPMTDEQIVVFLEHINGHDYECLFKVALFTGMRQSELLGLTWDCVNFTDEAIQVDKQLVKEKKEGWHL